jgi:hypothetical protein
MRYIPTRVILGGVCADIRWVSIPERQDLLKFGPRKYHPVKVRNTVLVVSKSIMYANGYLYIV